MSCDPIFMLLDMKAPKIKALAKEHHIPVQKQTKNELIRKLYTISGIQGKRKSSASKKAKSAGKKSAAKKSASSKQKSKKKSGSKQKRVSKRKKKTPVLVQKSKPPRQYKKDKYKLGQPVPKSQHVGKYAVANNDGLYYYPLDTGREDEDGKPILQYWAY